MWKSERHTANSKQQTAGILLFAACCLLFTASCRSDMQDQPKMKPYRGTTFFKDGLSSRQPIPGTVARGLLNADSEYFTGKKAGRSAPSASQPTAGPQPSGTNVVGGTPQGAAAYPDDVEAFPLPVTQNLVVRGKERYEIFCSACHGLTGNGDGMIVRRGFRRAASFNDDRLRQAPVGHFFDAISNGWGAMPSYAHQVPVKDRWAIIAYIRALQLSQEKQNLTTTGSPTLTPTPTPVQQNGGHQ
ncbi:MAG: cytochrome c [Acidobacteriota bacterium]|nr:cytochrome c [Acidobacteriota bacterium]